MTTSDRRGPVRSLGISVLAVLVAGAFAGLHVGCDSVGGAAANVLLPPREEEKLGDRVEGEFLDSGVQLFGGRMVEDYVRDLGERAVRAAGDDSPDAIEYEFKVIDEPGTVNAFAMPGGQIYFFTGLLTLADTQAEVMSVMSHEVAHVTERHIAEQLVLQSGLQAVLAAAVGENPGLVAELAAGLVGQGTLLTFGRQQEKEADRVGFEYMVEAGFDPEGFVSFFRKLDRQREVEVPTWLSSHPLPEDRVEAARERIGDRSFDDKVLGEEAHRRVVRAIEESGGGGDAGP